MKRFIISLLVVTMISAVGFSQKGTFSLNAPLGYTFKDRVKFDAAYADVSSGFQYGGGLEYYTSNVSSIELSYQRVGVDVPLYLNNGTKISEGDESGAVNYILLGFTGYLDKSPDAKAKPFLSGGLGVGILEGGGESATNFAWNLKAGVKINSGKPVYFKLNAYLQSVVSSFGADYWRTWYGVVAVPDYATLLQFGLGGAVCFDFKKK
jgi:opacity protein-like surface antigen